MLVFVPELDDVETQSVDIEVDVTLLEIGRHRLPNADFGMQSFNGLPCRLAQTLAMCLWLDEQYFQFALCILLVNLKNQTAYDLSIMDNAISFGVFIIYGAFNGLP